MTPTDRAFVNEARTRILTHLEARRNADLYDTIVAVVRSTEGTIYEGTPFETDQSQFDFCAERHALNTMMHAEPGGQTFDVILVAGPVPNTDADVTTPCGACRHAMYSLAPESTVYCSNFVREGEGWTMFPSIEQYTASELLPHHTVQPTWN